MINTDNNPVKMNDKTPENKKLMDFIKDKKFQMPWNENKEFNPLKDLQAEKNKLALNVSTGYDIPSLGNKTIEDLAETSDDGGIGKGGAAAISGGITALTEVPSIIANYSNKPETQQERTGQVLRTASSGAKIGGAVGTAFGPLGTAIGTIGGFAVGAGVGALSNTDWKSEAREQFDNESNKELEEIRKRRNQLYFKTKKSDEILNELNMHYQANGFPTTD